MGHPFDTLQPSQRLLAAARKAGVPVGAGKEAIDRWARESGWLKQGDNGR